MDILLNNTMMIHNYEMISVEISLLSGYAFDIDRVREYTKDASNTMIFFNDQMIASTEDENAVCVYVDTGYKSREKNDTIFLVFEKIDEYYESNQICKEIDIILRINAPLYEKDSISGSELGLLKEKEDWFIAVRKKQCVVNKIEFTDDDLISDKEYEERKYKLTCIENCKKQHSGFIGATIHNFKALRDLNALEMKPLTILCGTNSCGKSSFIDSILTLKQTQEKRNPNGGLEFNGDYVHLGSFNNIVFKHEDEKEIVLGFSYKAVEGKGKDIEPLARFIDNKIVKEKGEDLVLEFEVSIALPNSDAKEFITNTKVTHFKAEYKYPYCNSFIELNRKENSDYSCTYYISKYFEVQHRGKKLKTINDFDGTKDISGRELFNGFLIEPMRIWSHLKSGTNWDKHRNYGIQEDQLLAEFIMAINESITNLLDSVSYLGPLREAPNRRYIYDEMVTSIGVKGENAAFIFQTERNRSIQELFGYNTLTKQFEPLGRLTVFKAVDYWFNYMGIKSLNITNNQEMLRVTINDTNTECINVNITDVGFGVSQIFPIIF